MMLTKYDTFQLQPSGLPYVGSWLDEWYVDSVNGDDANAGRSALLPLKTLAAILAKPLRSGSTLYFASGSKWREEFTTAPQGVVVRSYGSGALPIVDGSDVAPNANFAAVGGATPHVYSIAWTAGFGGAGGKTAHRAWQDGVMLRRVVDVATCEATPGSFYAPAPTGGADTIYIHASDDSNVITNGKLYELSQRQWCVQLYSYLDHAHVYGIECRRNAHADGAVAVDGGIHSCIARDGRVHNVFVRGLCEDTDAIGMEPSTSGFSTSFVTHQDAGGVSPNGRNTIYRRCRALPGTVEVGQNGNHNVDTNIGFYAHVTDGTGAMRLGTLQYESCSAQNSLTAFDAAQTLQTLYYKCGSTNVKYGLSPHAGNEVTGTLGLLLVLGGTWNVAGVDSKHLMYSDDFQIPDTIIARGCRVYKTGGGLGPYQINIAGTSCSITRCTLVSDAGGGIPNLETGIFEFRENVTYAPANLLMMRLGIINVALPALTADYNCYWNTGDGGAHFQTGGAAAYVSQLSLAAWQAATGQEAHSLQQNPLLVDPANGDFTIGNAAVAAIAGAMTEESDATLQALWAQYKVA